MNSNFKFKILNSQGFTLIELIVVIAVTAILSGVVLYSVTQYVNKGKDSSVSANLSILIPAGEVYYNANSSSYSNFCNVTNSAVKNAVTQMPDNANGIAACYTASPSIPASGNVTGNSKGVCCAVASDGNSWAACAREFASSSYAYCVDSRGVKREILVASCTSSITTCGP